MYKKNSLVFALGTKVIAVFAVVHSIACFFRMNRTKDRRREGCTNVISAFPVPSLLCEIWSGRVRGWC